MWTSDWDSHAVLHRPRALCPYAASAPGQGEGLVGSQPAVYWTPSQTRCCKWFVRLRPAPVHEVEALREGDVLVAATVAAHLRRRTQMSQAQWSAAGSRITGADGQLRDKSDSSGEQGHKGAAVSCRTHRGAAGMIAGADGQLQGPSGEQDHGRRSLIQRRCALARSS
eukprot:gene6354-biopygen5410